MTRPSDPRVAVTSAGDAPSEAALLGERYALGSLLGEGGMGVVYQAHDRMLKRTVAVKVFREGTAEMARTAAETQILAGLNHPSLVTLYDAHVGDGGPRYLVMEYVDGPTLGERLAHGPLDVLSVGGVARDLGDALHVVHDAGIVHRDIKPSNVLLRASTVPGEQYRAKLADFGIAYLIDSPRLTTPGMVVGSAAYLSPEQVTGASPAPPADIYALGLLLLESLTGQRAFAQTNLHEAVVVRLSQDPVIPSSVDHDWAELLTAMTARDPERRPTAMEVVITVNAMVPHSHVEQDTVAAPVEASYGRRNHALDRSSTLIVAPVAPPFRTPSTSAPRTLELDIVSPDAASSTAHVRHGSIRRKWLGVLAAMTVIALVVVAGLLIWRTADESTTPPSLPAVEEPLGGHLQQLLDAVTP